MLSDQYKHFYNTGRSLSNERSKNQLIMSSLRQVQNEISAEILNKIQGPIRKRTLSKTPEKSSID